MDKILYMGINGSLLIAAVLCFRHFFFQKIPKRFLVFLWICAIARLLLPVAVPVRYSVSDRWHKTVSDSLRIYAGAFYNGKTAKDPGPDSDSMKAAKDPGIADFVKAAGYPGAAGSVKTAKAADTPEIPVIPFTRVLFIVWLAVAALLALRIISEHMRSCRLYAESLPVCEERTSRWLQEHRSFRKVTVRRSEMIRSPMTYGAIRPVILLPSGVSLNEEEFLCIMEHEWTHIRRWDVTVKYLLYVTVCLYWFHPLVWMMAVLLNRDMEMACDEEVVKKYPDHLRNVYALVLIRLAEGCRNSGCPFNACFARHSEIEERIDLIMKTKKYSRKAAALAAGMVFCAVTAFTVSAPKATEDVAREAENTQTGSLKAADSHTLSANAESNAAEKTAAKTDGTQPVRTKTDTAQDTSANMQELSEKMSEELENKEADGSAAADEQYGTNAQTAGDRHTSEHQASYGQTVHKQDDANTQTTADKPAAANGQAAHNKQDTADRQAADHEQNTANEQAVNHEIPAANGQAAGHKIQAANEQTAGHEMQAASGQTSGHEMQAASGQAAGHEIQAANEPAAAKQNTAHTQIAELAKKYLGNPYRSGGTDLATGVDSAGFVKAIYALTGIRLPADLHELAAENTVIPLEELSAGDVVIYSSANGDVKLSHAAIYDGSGQVIHASNMREGIKMSDLNYREISMAVRILN